MTIRGRPKRFGWTEDDVKITESDTLPESNCSKRDCLHFRGIKEGGAVTCDAFPEGIPKEIAYGPNPHRKPFPGDHGIQYEKAE
jgi:hypothetical protein